MAVLKSFQTQSFFSGATVGIGQDGLNPEHFPDGGPHPFPVFIRPEAVEHLTIVTPSSVEKIPEMVASVSSYSDRRDSGSASSDRHNSGSASSDRRNSGYARQLEIKPSAVNTEYQVLFFSVLMVYSRII